MKIEFTIKGITLDAYDLMKINQYYRTACIAEYLIENYKFSEERAMKVGSLVRDYMDKYNIEEDTAIEKILKEGK